jgi:hypothetical protein
MKFDKFKIQFKLLLTTKLGWISWGVANVITSLHWFIPFFIGFIGDNQVWYGYAAIAWGVGLSPFIPLWVFNVIIAMWINNKLRKYYKL